MTKDFTQLSKQDLTELFGGMHKIPYGIKVLQDGLRIGSEFYCNRSEASADRALYCHIKLSSNDFFELNAEDFAMFYGGLYMTKSPENSSFVFKLIWLQKRLSGETDGIYTRVEQCGYMESKRNKHLSDMLSKEREKTKELREEIKALKKENERLKKEISFVNTRLDKLKNVANEILSIGTENYERG